MIIFLYGPDTFRSRRKLKEVESRFIKTRDKSGLNVARFTAEKFDIAELRGAIFAAPFLSERRLVIVEGLLRKKFSNFHEEVAAILERIPESTILVFWDGDLPSRERGALFERLVKEKYAEEFLFLTPEMVAARIQTQAAKNGLRFEPEALRFLVREVAGDLWRLEGELVKLIFYTQARGKKIITDEDVSLLVSFKNEEALFPLLDAILAKNSAHSLKFLRRELSRGTPALVIFALLGRQIRLALAVKDFLERGVLKNGGALANALKIPAFVVQKISRAVKAANLNSLKDLHAKILLAEKSVKTGERPAETALETLVLRACGV